jgi:hypothetical protein
LSVPAAIAGGKGKNASEILSRLRLLPVAALATGRVARHESAKGVRTTTIIEQHQPAWPIFSAEP